MYYHYIKKEGDEVVATWPSWKEEKDCTADEMAQANMRQIRRNEIVLDCDHVKPEDVAQKLDSLKVSYEWYSSPRGAHFHLIFPELEKLADDEISYVRKCFIEEFDCDTSKAGVKTLIAIENKPHFKDSSFVKTLVRRVEGENKMPLGMLKVLEYKKTVITKELSIDKDAQLIDKLKNGIHEGERNETMFKIACSFRSRGFSKEFIELQIDSLNNSFCSPSLSEQEVNSIVESACKYEYNESIQSNNKNPIKFFEEYDTSKKPEWLVENLIPKKGITIIAAPPGHYKSFLAHEIISSLINERKFLNHFDIEKGYVLLVDRENLITIVSDRLKGLGSVPNNKLLIYDPDTHFSAMNQENFQSIKESLELYNPKVIIFDTLRRMHDQDENDSTTMNIIYKTFIKPLSKECCVILLAHTRKINNQKPISDDMSEIRGSGDIAGVADAIFMIKKNANDSFTIVPTKMRIGRLPDPINVKIIENRQEIKFEYSGIAVKDQISTDLERCQEDLLAHMSEHYKCYDTVRTKVMQDAMQAKGYGQRLIASVINLLCTRGYLKHTKRGEYQFIWGDDSVKNYV